MIAEVLIGSTLIVSGFLLMMPWADDVEPRLRACVAAPVGAALYVAAALGWVVVTGTLQPGAVLGLTAVMGAAGLAFGGHRSWNGRDSLWLAGAVAAGLAVIVVTRYVHFTRLTPDSLRYLLASNNLVEPSALAVIHPVDLHKRGFALPALHALSHLTDRRYLATIAPLFGLSGFALFLGVAWDMTRRMMTGPRVLLVATALAFLVSSNRLVYDSFYINTHIFVAVYVLVTVTGIWQAVFWRRRGCAVPAGLALASILLLRAEGPLLVALLLVVAAAHRPDRATRLWLSIPSLAVLAVWYGILWERTPGGDRLAFDAPIFGSIVAVAAAVAVLFATQKGIRGRWAGRVDLAMLAGMALVLGLFVAVQPAIFTASLDATIANTVLLEGHWQITWPVMVLLIGGALTVSRGPEARLWAVPVVGYGLLWWLLPYLREGVWRPGAGDSGNRLLAHILFVAVAYVVLATSRVPGDETGEVDSRLERQPISRRDPDRS